MARLVNIPRQSRGLYNLSRSKRLGRAATAAQMTERLRPEALARYVDLRPRTVAVPPVC